MTTQNTTSSRPSWDRTFMDLALVYARRSKDPSTQIGAVIVGPNKEQRSAGYNGMCRGIDDNVGARYIRPIKYKWMEHAERNAIYNAARVGIPLEGCSLYVSGMTPCSDCARAIIQSGIKEVITDTVDIPERWAEDFAVGREMLLEAGIQIHTIRNH